MFLDDDYVPSPQPFWFASSELSANLMRAELNALHRFLTEYPDFRKWFDSPEATLSERKVCLALLAHRKLFQLIDEKRVSMYDDPLSLDDRQLHALSQTSNLVAGDEPAWVREMNEVVERLPSRILAALPEPLHSQSFNTGNPEKDEASRSAAMTLSTVELIQALTEQVIDQQWRRLAGRWPTTKPLISAPPPVQINQPVHTTVVLNKQARGPNKRKGWQRRVKLYSTIQQILSKKSSLTGMKFCAELDKRHAQPLLDWQKNGQWPNGLTWKEAWSDPILRRKIRRVRQEAMRDR